MTPTIYRQTLTLDPNSPATRDVGALHKLVMAGYQHALNGGHDDARNRLNSLFLAQRATQGARGTTYPPIAGRAQKVLVQASTVGDWTHLGSHAGLTVSSPIPIDLSVNDGDQVEIQTLANALHSLPSELAADGKTLIRGKKVVITKPHDIAEWFVRTMNKNGLDIDPHAVAIGNPERLKGTRTTNGSRTPLNLDVRLLRGTGTITNQEAFTQMLTQGIGRGRPYGAGLIRHRKVT